MLNKSLRALAALLGVAATAVTLYSFITRPKELPEAEVYYADFEVPSIIAQQLRLLAPLADAEASRGKFLKPSFRQRLVPDSAGLVDQFINNMTAFTKERAPMIQHAGEFAFKGYWKVTVRNTGSKTASSVTLHFPVMASGVVSRPHLEATSVQELPASTAQVFTLGNIQPGDNNEVVVYAWTVTAATHEMASKIRLIHDLGTGEVHVIR
jgi:hypothetical protein